MALSPGSGVSHSPKVFDPDSEKGSNPNVANANEVRITEVAHRGLEGAPEDRMREAVVRADLFSYLYNTYVEQIKTFLRQGANADAADNHGRTALTVAAKRERVVEFVKPILAKAAKIEAADEFRDTVLMRAVQNKYVEVVEALIAAGASLEAADKDGRTALMFAAQSECVEVVEALIAAGANAEAADKFGKTTLMLAAERRFNFDVVNALLEGGVDLNRQRQDPNLDFCRHTALSIAIDNGDLNVVKALLKEGAIDHKFDKLSCSNELVDSASRQDWSRVAMLLARGVDPNFISQGKTALMEVAENEFSTHEVYNTERTITFLLDYGADIDAVAYRNENTALMLAALKGRTETVTILLGTGANPHMVNGDGRTALMLAADMGYANIVKILLEAGVDPDSTPREGEPLLINAARRGQIEIVRVLAENGATLDVEDRWGETALIHAACDIEPGLSRNCIGKNAFEITKILLKAGANPNALNKEREPVLVGATRLGREIVLELLLAAGANPNALNEKGEPVLVWAASYQRPELVKILLDRRASVDAQDGEGYTALMRAAQRRCVEKVEFLRDAWADPNLKNNEGRTAMALFLEAIRPGRDSITRQQDKNICEMLDEMIKQSPPANRLSELYATLDRLLI